MCTVAITVRYIANPLSKFYSYGVWSMIISLKNINSRNKQVSKRKISKLILHTTGLKHIHIYAPYMAIVY